VAVVGEATDEFAARSVCLVAEEMPAEEGTSRITTTANTTGKRAHRKANIGRPYGLSLVKGWWVSGGRDQSSVAVG